MSVGAYFNTTAEIFGGAIDDTPIGGTTASSAAFTTLDADGATTLDQVTIDTTDGIFSATGSNNVDFNVSAGISLDATAASNLTTSGGDLTLSATTNSVVITGAEAVADAILIDATDAAGGIDMDFGSGGLTAASDTGATESASGGISMITGAGGASAGGGAGGDAGDVAITGGTGGAGDGSNASGAGGSVSISAGAAGADGGGGAGAGGTIDVQSVGNLTLDSSGGSIGVGTDADTGAINIGTSATARTIAIGSSSSTTVTVDASGAVSLDAGAASNFTTSAGDLTLSSAGSAILTSSEATVDAIRIQASDAAGGIDVDYGDNGMDVTSSTGATGTASGAFAVVTGAGGAGSGADAPASGAISLTSGTGGAAVASFDGGDGGTITITGGDGGSGASGVDGGDGASVSIQPGAGGAAGSGSAGTAGAVNIGTTVSGAAVNIGHSTSEVTIGDNLTVTGDLTVSGTTTTVSSSTVTVDDPLLALASNNTSSDTVDIGFYGTYDSGAGDRYAGIVRDASNSGCFTFFKDATSEPTTTADVSTLADICVGTITTTGGIIESCEHISVAGGGSGSPTAGTAVTFVKTTGSGTATGTLADGTTDCQSHNILAEDVDNARKYELTVTNFRDAKGSSTKNKLRFKSTGQSAHLIWNNTEGFWQIREAGVRVTS